MPKGHPDDLRERLIESGEAGASRREAAEELYSEFSLRGSAAACERKREVPEQSRAGRTSPLGHHANRL
jgi:hypothetical protein